MSFLTIVITAVYQFYGWPPWSLTLMSSAGLVVVAYLIYRRLVGPANLVAQVRARQQAQAQERAQAMALRAEAGNAATNPAGAGAANAE